MILSLLCFILLSSLLSFSLSDTPTHPLSVKIDLDKSPEERWVDAIRENLHQLNSTMWQAEDLLNSIIPDDFVKWAARDTAMLILPHLGEYGTELKSISNLTSFPLPDLVLLNIFYELVAGCTSIVAQNVQGEIFHARNLDFSFAHVLRNLTMNVAFYKGGNLLFHATTYAGYVGVLTGMRPGSYSVSVNERDSGWRVENVLEALLVPDTWVSSLLIRNTFETIGDFQTAVKRLSTTSFPATVYIIVGGASPGEGVVITRDREYAVDMWDLDVPDGRWFLVETNFDHWKAPGDDRRATANEQMEQLSMVSIDLEKLFHVLSVPPVLAPKVTYTTLMSASTGNYTTWVRHPSESG